MEPTHGRLVCRLTTGIDAYQQLPGTAYGSRLCRMLPGHVSEWRFSVRSGAMAKTGIRADDLRYPGTRVTDREERIERAPKGDPVAQRLPGLRGPYVLASQ